MVIIQYTLYALLFLFELIMLAAFSYWGFYQAKGQLLKVVFSIVTPVLIAIFWGMLLAPKAIFIIPIPLKLLLQFLVFLLAALAFYSTGKTTTAIVFFVSIVIVKLLVLLLSGAQSTP